MLGISVRVVPSVVNRYELGGMCSGNGVRRGAVLTWSIRACIWVPPWNTGCPVSR
jgi:hypothetical protein